MYVGDDDHGEYFDSLNTVPLSEFQTFMDRNCFKWITSRKQLQSAASRFCGHYCILFCALRFLGNDIERICQMFSNDTGLNDAIVHLFVCSRLKY